MNDGSHNVVSFERLQKGQTLARVRLNTDLEPERVLEHLEEGVMYKKGWEGSILAQEGTGNHAGHVAVLFDDYIWPVWINKEYLDPVV